MAEQAPYTGVGRAFSRGPAVILGLATVITASPVLCAAIRFAGALYLVVLGLLALRRGSSLDAGAPASGPAVAECGGRSPGA